MKKNKKRVLITSLAYIIYFAIIWVVGTFCHASMCDIQEDGPFGIMLYIFLPLAPLFVLSLITYKMRDEIFRAWWNFARWLVPIIVVTTLLLASAGSGGGYLGMQQDFTLLILGSLYTVLIAVSLFKIIWEYLGMKDRKHSKGK